MLQPVPGRWTAGHKSLGHLADNGGSHGVDSRVDQCDNVHNQMIFHGAAGVGRSSTLLAGQVMSSRYDFIQRAKAPQIESMYVRYRRTPHRSRRSGRSSSLDSIVVGAAAPPSRRRAWRVQVMAIGQFGHLIAQLDPLEPVRPSTRCSGAGLSDSDLDQLRQGATVPGRVQRNHA